MEEQRTAVNGEVACCQCPYCDQSMEKPFPFCQACGATLRFCTQCGQPLPGHAKVCPHCGAQVSEE